LIDLVVPIFLYSPDAIRLAA